MIRNIGWSLSAIAAIAAPNAPRMNWPSTPMLNAPLRNEIATARPVKISGVAATSVSVIGRTAAAMARGVGSAMRGDDARRVAERADCHRAVGVDDRCRARRRWRRRVRAELREVLEVRDQDEDRADDERRDDREDRDERRAGWRCATRLNGRLPSASRPSRRSPRRPRRRPRPGPLHDRDAVADGEHLVELGADDEDRGPLVALLHDPLVDVLDRADVEAAGGLRGDDELERARELAGDDDLLLVAARQRARVGVDPGRPDVVVLDRLLGGLRRSPCGRAGCRGCTAPGGTSRG